MNGKKNVGAWETIRVVRINGKRCDAKTQLEHNKLPDPIAQVVQELNSQIARLEERLTKIESGTAKQVMTGKIDRKTPVSATDFFFQI